MRAGRGRRHSTAAAVLMAGVLLAGCAGIQPRNVQGGTTLDGGQAAGTTTTSGGPGAFGGSIPDLPATLPPARTTPRGSTNAFGTPRATPTPTAARPSVGAGRGPVTGSPTPTSPLPTIPTPAVPTTGGDNGGATDVGVTADSIRLGGFFVESGPAGALGITLLKAAKAVFNEVNAQGGIYGRKIQIVDCDTSFTSGDRPRSCFEKLTGEDKVFAFASSGDGQAMVSAAPLICKQEIPAIAMDGLASEEFKCPSIFPAGPPARSQSHVLADYYARRYKPRTVGFLVENDDIGNQWLQGAKEVFTQLGVTVVAEQRYNLGETNFNPQVLGMQAAGPDFVFFAGEPQGGMLFQLQSQALGYKPPMPGAGVTCDVEMWPREVGDYAKGMVCQHPWALARDGLPEHGVFERTYKKYWNDWDWRSSGTEISWAAAKAVVATLRAAGPNLTRARVLEVLRGGALDGFDTGFGVRFSQSAGPDGGHVLDTQVAVVEITEPSGQPSYYETRQAARPDPHFTLA